jgi:hypothetical protein
MKYTNGADLLKGVSYDSQPAFVNALYYYGPYAMSE